MPAWWRDRGPGLLALAIPALAGLAYLAGFGAPAAYPAINAAALCVAALWITFGRAPSSATGRRALASLLLAGLLLPLATGPELDGVSRWVPLGPFALHAGMVAVPPLAVLAASDDRYAAPILLAALFAAWLQPDAATGLALTFAAIGIHHVGRDWKVGVVGIAGFVASIAMVRVDALPAQPFVERVLVELAERNGWAAGGLVLALAAGFALMLGSAPLERKARFALAGSLFGFTIISLMANYPSPLIGYGASPILGYGLALGLRRRLPA